MIKYITPALLICSLACSAENKKTTEQKAEIKKTEVVVNETTEKLTLEKQDSNSDIVENVIEKNSLPEEKEIKTTKVEETKTPIKEEKEIAVIVEETKETVEEIAETPEPVKDPVAYSPSHSAFNALLVKHVTADGKVNYTGFKTDKPKLDEYLSILSKNAPTEKWTKNEKLAYWINLYNAGTIQLILINYPVKSIMEINGGKAWDLKFIKSGSQTLSLNQIENEIIRPRFKEPRIHFAVNCAAKSCPKLLNKAFYAHILDKQLHTATKKFINNSYKNTITPSTIKISKIFEWYAIDFGGKEKLINYFNQYSNTKINSNAKISFMEYNWDLNN